MNNPRNTIEELLEIKEWLLATIEKSNMTDQMCAYAPNIRMSCTISLESKEIPTTVLKAVKNKFYKGK